MTPWVGNVKQTDLIEIIQQAMEQSALLRFDYTDRQGQKSCRSVEPYRLLLKGMHWYLDAYCLERQDFRMFKLSRMSGLTSMDTVFSRREYQPTPIVQPDFQDENIVYATLRVRGSAVERLEDLFGPEVFGEIDGEWVTARIPILNDKRGYQFLIAFGADCICVEPERVRRGMQRYLREIVDIYSNTIQ